MKKLWLKIRFSLAIIFFIVSLVLFSYLVFINYHQNKFFPGTKIAGENVSGKNIFTVTRDFNKRFGERKEKQLNLIYKNQSFTLNLNAGLPETDLGEVLQKTYSKGRTGNVLIDIKDQIRLLIIGEDFSPKIKFKNPSQISSQISLINQKIKKDAIPAQIVFSDTINIVPSQEGIALDDKALTNSLENYLALKQDAPAIIPTKILLPTLTTATAEKYKKILEKTKESPVKLYSGNDSWTIDQATLYSLLNLDAANKELISFNKEGQNFSLLTEQETLLDQDKLSDFIKSIAQKTDQPLKEAKFVFDEKSQRVTQFEPGQEGRQLNIEKTSSLISDAFENGNVFEIQLPVELTYPKTSTGEVNDYGIRELLGTGTSSFIDSIPNRVFNIGLASFRTNGILIPPGEIFSFNHYIGEISAATGYKQAYVIKEGKTVLDDGGGVCQVSTTLFRAVLNAGLPITERTAHAYRVGFYEQGGTPPGFDATVYPPSVDFKFKNDTEHYILIQNQMLGTTLTFRIYGTSDGRVTTVGKPVVLSQTPPPPDLRQDDPTLPKGTEKEAEHAIWGMNTQFKRTVTRSGETLIDEVWRSNFRPWQKITLVGTKE